jgi:hypothetical protein
MKGGRIVLALITVGFILAGCGKYQLVESGHRATVGECFRVDPEIPWSMTKEAGIVIWTVDGHDLEQLLFFPGIKDGAPLIDREKTAGSPPMPTYKDSMTLLEVVDLLEATMARLNYHQFEKQDLRPATIGGLDGFRVDFSFVSKQGLEYRGVAAGVKKNHKLYLVMYMGTTLHYYGRYEAIVDRIITGMEIL